MKIEILGTRGEIEDSAPYHSKKSGVLINDTLLLDCGDERFLQYDPKAILITHLHPDHAYFTRREYEPFDTPIYAPEKYDNYNITVTNKPFIVAGYHVVPIPTVHSIKVKSNAYLISYNSKRILYTGDMIWIEKKYQNRLKPVDLVITEASYMRKGGLVRRQKETGKIFGHTGVPNLIHFFEQYTNTMLFIHFGAWFYKDMAKGRKQFRSLAREYDMDFIVGYDGLMLTI